MITHFQHAIVDFAFQFIHRPWRGPGNSRAVLCKHGHMTRANEFLLRFVPRNRTTKMRTDRRQDACHAVFHRQHIHRLFCNDLPPGIALLDLDQFFYWRRCSTTRMSGMASAAPITTVPKPNRTWRNERRLIECSALEFAGACPASLIASTRPYQK